MFGTPEFVPHNTFADKSFVKFSRDIYRQLLASSKFPTRLDPFLLCSASNSRAILLEQFKKDLKVHFNVEFQETDFTNATAAAQLINAWIEQRTQQKIKDLIDPSSIDAAVDMMLANAIYFKGMSSMT